MAKIKVAVTLDKDTLAEVDQLVDQHVYPSRSQVIQEAVLDKLDRIHRRRLAEECANLDPTFEKALAEEGLSEELEQWPEY
jgi:metal-responsive CopG/Arc/MetJ family transcriptional regulator